MNPALKRFSEGGATSTDDKLAMLSATFLGTIGASIGSVMALSPGVPTMYRAGGAMLGAAGIGSLAAILQSIE